MDEKIRKEGEVIEEVVAVDRVNRLVEDKNNTRKSTGKDLHFRKSQLIAELFWF